MKEKKIILFFLAFALAFLGLPVPDWLGNFVSVLAGILTSILGTIIKLIQLLLTFGKIL